MTSAAAVHHSKTIDPAKDFGKLADAYELGRPLYPSGSIRSIATNFRQGSVLLDMGAGNGRTLRSIFNVTAPDHFSHIHAVEPSFDMRGLMENSFGHIGHLNVHNGTFDNIPLTDQSVENIVCGASIH